MHFPLELPTCNEKFQACNAWDCTILNLHPLDNSLKTITISEGPDPSTNFQSLPDQTDQAGWSSKVHINPYISTNLITQTAFSAPEVKETCILHRIALPSVHGMTIPKPKSLKSMLFHCSFLSLPSHSPHPHVYQILKPYWVYRYILTTLVAYNSKDQYKNIGILHSLKL
jgi:hypothetical protein